MFDTDAITKMTLDFVRRRNEVVEGIVAELLFGGHRVTRIVEILDGTDRTLIANGDTVLAGIFTERDGLTFTVRSEKYPGGLPLRTFFGHVDDGGSR